MAKAPIDELDQLHATSTAELSGLLGQVEVARLRGDWAKRDRLMERLGDLLGQVAAGADLLGRRRILLELDAITGGEGAAYAVKRPGIFFLPPVGFREAVADLIEREPRLAPGWEATQATYIDGGFAAARAASERIAEHVQKTVDTAIRRGTSQELVENRILQALRTASPAEAEAAGIDPAGFTRAYADTVFRTLSASSYARGRRAQAQDPAIRRSVAGWRFTSAGDEDVRHNHQAADGLVAHFDDPVWKQLAPPLGYRCRCSLEMVPTVELRMEGLADAAGNMTGRAAIPAGASADAGFVAGGGAV